MYITNKGSYLEFSTQVHDWNGCQNELAGDITNIIGKDRFDIHDSGSVQKLAEKFGMTSEQIQKLALIADKNNLYSNGANHTVGNNDGYTSTLELSKLLMLADAADNNSWLGTGGGYIFKSTLDGIISSNPVEVKPADASHDAAGGEHDAGHDATNGHGSSQTKPPVSMGKRDKVSDKDEDQNGTKASLKSEDGKTTYYDSWTAYAKKLNGEQEITSVDQLMSMFGITKPAAEAIMTKAKAFNSSNITDGVGQVLQDIDKNDGAWDGHITIGKFNDYVEHLLPQKAEKPKASGGGGGGNSSNKVEINNGADTEALNKKIAELEKEIEALKKEDEPPKEVAKAGEKKGKNRGLLLAGAGLLAAGAAFFAIKDRRDRQQYAQQLNNPPQPFCPPLPPAPLSMYPQPVAFNGQFQGLVQGPFQAQGSQNMFGNVLA